MLKVFMQYASLIKLFRVKEIAHTITEEMAVEPPSAADFFSISH